MDFLGHEDNDDDNNDEQESAYDFFLDIRDELTQQDADQLEHDIRTCLKRIKFKNLKLRELMYQFLLKTIFKFYRNFGYVNIIYLFYQAFKFMNIAHNGIKNYGQLCYYFYQWENNIGSYGSLRGVTYAGFINQVYDTYLSLFIQENFLQSIQGKFNRNDIEPGKIKHLTTCILRAYYRYLFRYYYTKTRRREYIGFGRISRDQIIRAQELDIVRPDVARVYADLLTTDYETELNLSEHYGPNYDSLNLRRRLEVRMRNTMRLAAYLGATQSEIQGIERRYRDYILLHEGHVEMRHLRNLRFSGLRDKLIASLRQTFPFLTHDEAVDYIIEYWSSYESDNYNLVNDIDKLGLFKNSDDKISNDFVHYLQQRDVFNQQQQQQQQDQDEIEDEDEDEIEPFEPFEPFDKDKDNNDDNLDPEDFFY